MNKEPIGLYIFRFVLGLGLFGFMCMLYWSSTLIEDGMKNLRMDISQLKSDIFNLRTESIKIREDVLQLILDDQRRRPMSGDQTKNTSSEGRNIILPQTIHAAFSGRPHIDASLPNLLQEDPFYQGVLQKLLPPNFKPKGTLQSATIGKYDNLNPFSKWAEVSTWNDLCTVAVAKSLFGRHETMAPDMAIKMEERYPKGSQVPEYWIHLRDNVYWQPLDPRFFSGQVILAPQFLRKNKVTAHDFKFYYDAVMNPSVQEAGAVALRAYLTGIKEIEVIDDLTFVVRWNSEEVVDETGNKIPKIKYVSKLWTGALRPLASFVYQYFPDGKKILEDDAAPDTYRTNSVWAQNFSQHWARNIIISCGGWAFDGWTERQIRLRRNPDFYLPYAVLVDAMEVHFKESPDSEWQDFKENKLDSYNLQPSQLIEWDNFMASAAYQKQLKEGQSINRLDYVSRLYAFIGWNEAKEFFKSKKVRQAMTMAIDRQRIIKQNLNGMGIEITGTFFPYSSAYDKSIVPWPFDLHAARALLEEEGWHDLDGEGVLSKMINGKKIKFQFSLTYYVKNPLTKSICEYVSTSLKEIGVICNLNGVDVADLSAMNDDKSFDALCLGWTYGSPPEDPRQLWYSSGAKVKGSSNTIGFVNKEVDKIIDALDYEYDPQKRIALYHRFDQIIHEEAPYTFLYTPKTILLYRNYLKNVFLPVDRQDLIPGANVAEPESSIYWLEKTE